MAEYIEREAAISYIKDNQCKRCSDIGLCGKCAVLTAIKLFESIPAADVRPVVRGKWIWDDEGYHCSECCYHAYGETGEVMSGHWNYCPNCGADMRGEQDE